YARALRVESFIRRDVAAGDGAYRAVRGLVGCCHDCARAVLQHPGERVSRTTGGRLDAGGVGGCGQLRTAWLVGKGAAEAPHGAGGGRVGVYRRSRMAVFIFKHLYGSWPRSTIHPPGTVPVASATPGVDAQE